MLAPLFRHRRVVIGTFGVVLVAAILLTWLWASQYYAAKMQVVVEQDAAPSGDRTDSNGHEQGSDAGPSHLRNGVAARRRHVEVGGRDVRLANSWAGSVPAE
jgi:uncharacterized protein involved in exopolysaccharide biosynthesis